MTSRTERQKESVKKWIQAGCNATISASTGFGKTNVSMMAIMQVLKKKPDAKVLIVVPTEVLKKQWTEDYIEKYSLTENCEVQIINSVIKKQWDVDLLVLDEIHLYAADTFQMIFVTVSYNMVLGLTATLERLDGKDLIIKQYAPVCDVITIEDATASGWCAPYKEYVVLLDVDLTQYNKWNQEFISFFSQLGFDFGMAMSLVTDPIKRRKYAKKLGIDYKQLDAIVFGWMDRLKKRKAFVQSHPQKLKVARKILNARKDQKCLTFCSTIKESEALSEKGEFILHSQKSKKDNNATINEFNEATCGVLHSSKAAKQGLDIKGLSVEIILNTDSSKITKVQKVGRAIRYSPGKQAEIFTLIIKNTVEEKWLANSATSNYIVINEQQLEKVLNHEPINVRERTLNKDINNRF